MAPDFRKPPGSRRISNSARHFHVFSSPKKFWHSNCLPLCMNVKENHTRKEGGREMSQIKTSILKNEKYAIGFLLLIALLSVLSALAFPEDSSKPETIEATARGTESEAGKQFPVTLTIYKYSSPKATQILTDAFHGVNHQGLFDPHSNMQ